MAHSEDLLRPVLDRLISLPRSGDRPASVAGSDVFDVLPRHRFPASASRDHTPRSNTPSSTHSSPDTMHHQSFCVISGGTGANAIVGAFTSLGPTSFILPISDNGGSSSEIIRVVGGPSIGDIRSRLVRLIPQGGSEADRAIKRLLEHRLSSSAGQVEVKQNWLAIVEGQSDLWRGIPADRRETLRAFLTHFETELLKRAHKRFNFRSGSIGNFVLAGAMLFCRSIESAIFLFAAITSIPPTQLVIPCIHTNSVATIAAELQDSTIVVGQMNISHPAPVSSASKSAVFEGPQGLLLGDDDAMGHGLIGRNFEDSFSSSFIELSRNVTVLKDGANGGPAYHPPPLSAKINRVYYINSYGQEVSPKANPNFLKILSTVTCLVFSCGSLYTSLVPCLALRGVGRAIATSPTLKYKVLLLNSVEDRETPGMDASDYLSAIRKNLNYPSGLKGENAIFQASDYITHLLVLEDGQIPVNRAKVELLGITIVMARPASTGPPGRFDEVNVREALETVLLDDSNETLASSFPELDVTRD